jgi:hypothetical protein
MKKLLVIVFLGFLVCGTTNAKSDSCRSNKNFIYYESVDEKYKGIKLKSSTKSGDFGPRLFRDFFFHPDPVNKREEFFESFSLLLIPHYPQYSEPVDRQIKVRGEVEFIFNSDGSMTATDLKKCKIANYTWEIYGDSRLGKILLGEGENSTTKEFGMDLGIAWNNNTIYYNNSRMSFVRLADPEKFSPNKPLSVWKIIGFRDLKNNFTYEKLLENLDAKIAEEKRKDEERRKAEEKREEQKKRAAEERIKAEEKREAEERRKQEEKRLAQEKEFKKQEAYNNSPEGQLHNAYLSYLRIKGFYAARKGYAIVFVTSIQMSDARSKVKEIENTIVKKNKIDSETIWNKAVKIYEDKEKESMDGIISSGTYSKYLSDAANSNLFALTSIHSDVTGGTKIEKDF